jgi:nicotinamidase-related amidase
MVLTRHRSCLVIVDVQERLTPLASDPRRVLQSCSLLMRAAQRLGVPILVTEQDPQRLGPTMVAAETSIFGRGGPGDLGTAAILGS